MSDNSEHDSEEAIIPYQTQSEGEITSSNSSDLDLENISQLLQKNLKDIQTNRRIPILIAFCLLSVASSFILIALFHRLINGSETPPFRAIGMVDKLINSLYILYTVN